VIPKVAGETICALSAWVVKYTHIYNGHLLSKKTYTGKWWVEERSESDRAVGRARDRARVKKRVQQKERRENRESIERVRVRE